MRIDAAVMDALDVLERERGIPQATILEALANALVTAYKSMKNSANEARVTIDIESGEIRVYAQELDNEGNVVKEWEDTPTDFGRIAAQSARSVISQKLQEAQRNQVFELYGGREGDLVTGIVQQIDPVKKLVILDLGDAEALMPAHEKIPFEKLERGNRIRALVIEVRAEGKGPQVVVSRSHPDLVRRLLELEVPELVDGTIEIAEIAREAGHRTKISVISHDPTIDPKGACVGGRGSRVRQVVTELRGEKVDVVHWRNDPAQFVTEALGPAKVKEVQIDQINMVAHVLVSNHQLSLAIGKEGQNARLAARLSGYKIDIRSDASVAEEETPESPEKSPETESPETESPETESPETESPEAESPETESADPSSEPNGEAGDEPTKEEPDIDTDPTDDQSEPKVEPQSDEAVSEESQPTADPENETSDSTTTVDQEPQEIDIPEPDKAQPEEAVQTPAASDNNTMDPSEEMSTTEVTESPPETEEVPTTDDPEEASSKSADTETQPEAETETPSNQVANPDQPDPVAADTNEAEAPSGEAENETSSSPATKTANTIDTTNTDQNVAG